MSVWRNTRTLASLPAENGLKVVYFSAYTLAVKDAGCDESATSIEK